MFVCLPWRPIADRVVDAGRSLIGFQRVPVGRLIGKEFGLGNNASAGDFHAVRFTVADEAYSDGSISPRPPMISADHPAGAETVAVTVPAAHILNNAIDNAFAIDEPCLREVLFHHRPVIQTPPARRRGRPSPHQTKASSYERG